MCNPRLFNCAAAHFPLVIDSALERLHESQGEEIHLSRGAQDVLYHHGNQHKTAFESALVSQDQAELDRLSTGLHRRLQFALLRSVQKDPNGRAYNPARIDEQAMKQALKNDPWVP